MKGHVSEAVPGGTIALVLGLIACAAPTIAPAPGVLNGGILARFEVVDEEFRVWVTDPDTIKQILELQRGAANANIPNGRILRGPGQGEHNQPWSWHLDPEQIEIAQVAVEVCDGTPSFVEEELDYFVGTVGEYCPWSALGRRGGSQVVASGRERRGAHAMTPSVTAMRGRGLTVFIDSWGIW